METEKILNLLNSPENKYSIFETKKLYVFVSESKTGYLHHDPIKFLAKPIESSLCDYSDAYVLVTGNITVTRTVAVDPDANPAVEKRKTTTCCSYTSSI